MGRYKTELRLSTDSKDKAGPYLAEAREARKDRQCAQSTQQIQSKQQTNSDQLWPEVDIWDYASQIDTDINTAAAQILENLQPGGRVAFPGLSKEERAMIHRLAHGQGLQNSSASDPNRGEGARILRIGRPASTKSPVSYSPMMRVMARHHEEVCKAQEFPKSDTCAPIGSDHDTKPKRNRWRRAGTLATKATPCGTHDNDETNDVSNPTANKLFRNASCAKESLRRDLGHCTPIDGTVCIVWLRDDMRLHDNPALLRAASGSFSAVVPVFVHDTHDQDPHPIRGAALYWKHESLSAFSVTLASCNSRLVVRRGDVVHQLLEIVSEVGKHTMAKHRVVVYNRRCEPWHYRRDEAVAAALRDAGLNVESCPANVLFEPWDLQPIERWQRWRAKVRAEDAQARGAKAGSAALKGEPKELEHISGFGSYRFFHHALEELGDPPQPCKPVRRLPPCPSVMSLGLEDLEYGHVTGCGFTSALRQSSSSNSELPNHERKGDWAHELRQWWSVGEAAALQRLELFLKEVLTSGDFEGRKRLLASCHNTSELSPYIRFGELSARTVYWTARKCKEKTDQKLYNDPYYPGHGRANATFLRRFIWRDLSYWFLWEFPTMPTVSIRPQYEEEVWAGTRQQLLRWKKGTTGFPLVDAAMRQLWCVGWMPNYLRHLVAQMLVEYLDISWKEGLLWFDWTLVDGDVAINSFMWQNGGHSGPDQWEFVLHPINAAKSCDPDGSYVRRWVPELAGVPSQFIHRPWDIPARLVAGPSLTDYPRRVIADLDEARRAHARHVIDVRKRHPEIVSRTGHEWIRLPGRRGLLAKVVTRDEFRAETEDFLWQQTPCRSHTHSSKGRKGDVFSGVLADAVKSYEDRGPDL